MYTNIFTGSRDKDISTFGALFCLLQSLDLDSGKPEPGHGPRVLERVSLSVLKENQVLIAKEVGRDAKEVKKGQPQCGAEY